MKHYTTEARDLGTSGEDNTYGTGLIDVYAAYQSLGTPDLTPPNPIVNVSVINPTSNSLELQWTVPFDSSDNGIIDYDIRYSLSPITDNVLKKEGIWVYGASGEANDIIYDLDLNIDLAIVIGAEGKGIRPLVKKKCDRLFSVPIRGPVSSFNASVSGGMILYEVMRQRYAAGEWRSS